MKTPAYHPLTPGEFRRVCLRTWVNWHCAHHQEISRQALQQYVWKLEQAVRQIEKAQAQPATAHGDRHEPR